MPTNNRKVLTAAIIGLGNVGYKFSLLKNIFPTTHWEAFLNNPRINLVAVADQIPSAELIKEAKTKGIKLYRNYQELLKKENPEIVSIATPDNTHFDILKHVVKIKSVKAIWCEKPLAIPLADARSMVALCKTKKIALLVNFIRRYDELYRYLKTNLKTIVGNPQALTFYYTGGIVTTGSHLLDLLVYLFGEARSVSATHSNGALSGTIRFKNLLATIVPLETSNYSSFELNIFGDTGRLDIINRFFGDYDYRVIVLETNPRLNAKLLATREIKPFTTKFPRDFFASALNDLISSLDKKTEPVSSGVTALASLELIHALTYSAEHKGVVVNLPFKFKVKSLPKSGGNFKR